MTAYSERFAGRATIVTGGPGVLDSIPMGRFGDPEEIARMICWLASEELSFCTGAVFDASGGRVTY